MMGGMESGLPLSGVPECERGLGEQGLPLHEGAGEEDGVEPGRAGQAIGVEQAEGEADGGEEEHA